ncbi:hypothetical protein DERF_014262 [Dermatophagoides farinae]|uniref:Uncharacterized protein n=1 Tax=Dermatophagoides farinae TaxID=6954 RepID=A0A922HH98_DERFA|nr:hypothetical protein DERF_014262 [Dermatophagoides farinae]
MYNREDATDVFELPINTCLHNVNHMATSRDCPVMLRIMKNSLNQINYAMDKYQHLQSINPSRVSGNSVPIVLALIVLNDNTYRDTTNRSIRQAPRGEKMKWTAPRQPPNRTRPTEPNRTERTEPNQPNKRTKTNRTEPEPNQPKPNRTNRPNPNRTETDRPNRTERTQPKPNQPNRTKPNRTEPNPT